LARLGIENDTLEQGLPYTLRNTSLHLSERHAWVDETAEIIRDRVAIEPHDAGVWIDLDFRDMASIRKIVEV
jgi:hypothetical protein